VTEQPDGTLAGVTAPPSQLRVKLPLAPDTEKAAQLLLLNVIDAACVSAAPKVNNVLQQIAAAACKVRII